MPPRDSEKHSRGTAGPQGPSGTPQMVVAGTLHAQYGLHYIDDACPGISRCCDRIPDAGCLQAAVLSNPPVLFHLLEFRFVLPRSAALGS